ncbi:MAG TPA: transporter substrate-binding domain-containing protein [Patescibacteria group bacterium]|nr:transporter substrate-binding domain-containing protein [Patescibacteria group bacterium]
MITKKRRSRWLASGRKKIIVWLLWSIALLPVTGLAADLLTAKERDWLAERDSTLVVAPCPEWPPLDYFDEWDNYQGMVADYLRLLEQKLNIRFKIVRTASFAESIDVVRERRADLITSVSDLPERRRYLAVTSPYVTLPIVTIVRADKPAPDKLANMRGWRIVTVKDYYPYFQMKESLPQLEVTGVDSDREALRMLSLGEADAVVTDLSVASYHISREGLANLRVAGETGWAYRCGLGVRSDYPELVSILEKGLAQISEAEKKEIYHKWVHLDMEPVWQRKEYVIPALLVVAIAMTAMLVVLVWNRSLRRRVSEQTTVLQEKVSELQVTQTELAVSREVFYKAFHSCSEVIGLVKTSDWLYVEINEAYTRVLGYRRSEVIGKNSCDFGLWRVSEERERIWNLLHDHQEVREQETHWQTKDGRILYGMLSAAQVDIGGEKHTVFIWRDETAQRQAAEALRREKIFTDAIFDSIPGILYLYDDQGNLIRWNRQHQEMTGYSAEEMAQMTLLDWYRGDEETQQRILREVQRGLEEGFATTEADLQKKDGTVIPMYFTAVSLRIGEELYFTGIGIDVTKRKEMEQKLKGYTEDLEEKVEQRTQELTAMNEELIAMNEEMQATNDELLQLNDQLKETRESLLQAENVAALARLVTGVAHEMNTPVGVCITLGSHMEEANKNMEERIQQGSLRRTELDEYMAEQGEAIRMLRTNMDRAAALINNFKEISIEQRGEEGHWFNVQELLEETIGMLWEKIHEPGHRITLVCPETIKLWGYPRALRQIMSNLLTNSLVHAYEPGQNGEITVRVEAEEDNIIILYSDNGKGMDNETLSRVFNPFFTTRRSQGYSGLGMAVVFNLVTQLYQGKISCDNAPAGGVVFRMVLPENVGTNNEFIARTN